MYWAATIEYQGTTILATDEGFSFADPNVVANMTDGDIARAYRWYHKKRSHLDQIATVRQHWPDPNLSDEYLSTALYYANATADEDKPLAAIAQEALLYAHRRKLHNEWIRSSKRDKRQTKPGWVYILGGSDTEGSIYKIGMTTRQPEARLMEFTPKLPFKTNVVCIYQCPDVAAEEKYLHGEFADKRVLGEWFRLTDKDIVSICDKRHAHEIP